MAQTIGFVLWYVVNLSWTLCIFGYGDGESAIAYAVRIAPDDGTKERAFSRVKRLRSSLARLRGTTGTTTTWSSGKTYPRAHRVVEP